MASVVRWRWSEREPDHFEIQCEHMAVRWSNAGYDIHPDDPFLWAVMPLHPDKGWVITQRDPLTVVPSIHLLDCGCHGWITNGEWVSC